MLTEQEKEQLILRWWREGKIKRLGSSHYYDIPMRAYIYGLTPELIAKVIEKQEVK